MSNPFGSSFESLESPGGSPVEVIHQDAYCALGKFADSEDGQLVLLQAPRAGYGKTMLLSRLRQAKKEQLIFVPVRLAEGHRADPEIILEDFLGTLIEALPGQSGQPGLSRLDFLTRRLFCQALLPLVKAGEVPCQDREGAISSLEERPTEALDFHHQGAAIARWSRDQFAILESRFTSVLSKISGASAHETASWVRFLFNYATRPPAEVDRTSLLMESVFGSASPFRAGSGYPDALSSLANLVTLLDPLLLVLDEVDGLFDDPESTVRAASCLVSLRESAARLKVVVSVNDDVWTSAFVPSLPAGLLDRFEDAVIRLKPLTTEHAQILIEARAGNAASRILPRLDLTGSNLYPRGVLKAARALWDDVEPAPKPVFAEVPVQVSVYPPAPVNRATLPKAFSVERIHKKSSSYPPKLVKRAALPKSFQVERLSKKPTYPPGSIKRASLPKAFSVERSRREAEPEPLDFATPVAKPPAPSPFNITKPKVVPEPEKKSLPLKGADAIEALLRQRRDRKGS